MKPEKIFRIGNVSASVFTNEVDGGNRHVRTVNLQKRYRSGEEWKFSSSFYLGELPQARAVLELATAYVADKEAEIGGG